MGTIQNHIIVSSDRLIDLSDNSKKKDKIGEQTHSGLKDVYEIGFVV